MWWDAVLIDFDNTLADTRPLEALREECRRNRTWTRYFQRVPEAEPVKTAVGEPVVALCDGLAQLKVPHAIVSNSPKGAVDAWFTGRSLRQPRTFGAVNKPATSGLLEACQALGVANVREAAILLIDDGFDGALAGFQADIWTATVVPETDLNEPPDYFIPNLAAVFDTDELVHLAGDPDRHGSPGHLSAVLGDTELFVAGRHRTSHDSLSDALRAKPTGTWPENLYILALGAIHASNRSIAEMGDVITAVPPHPGRPNRFEHLLGRAAKETYLPLESLLRWTRPTQSQRGLGRAGRAENLANSMTVEGNVEGAVVIVFDDVVTTGATMIEAVRALGEAGAGAVVCAAIAKTAWDRPGTPAVWVPPPGVPKQAPKVAATVAYERVTTNYSRWVGHHGLGRIVVYLPKEDPVAAAAADRPGTLAIAVAPADESAQGYVFTRARETDEFVEYRATTSRHGSFVYTPRHPPFVLVPDAAVQHLGTPELITLTWSPNV